MARVRCLSLALFVQVRSFTTYLLPSRRVHSKPLSMSMNDLPATQVVTAMPSVEEWLDFIDPELKKATLAMFRSCKEIAYKIRTASCDKMACFNEFGKFSTPSTQSDSFKILIYGYEKAMSNLPLIFLQTM